MKKSLFALILVLCLVFASCSAIPGLNDDEDDTNPDKGITVDSVEKDPAASIANAALNTFKSWSVDDTGISDAIAETLKGGAVKLHLSGDTLFEQMDIADLTAIDAAWYTKDLKENMIELTMTSAEGTVPARVWINSDGIAASGALLFKDDAAYKLSYDALKDREWLMSVTDILSQYFPELPAGEELGAMLDQVPQTEKLYTELSAIILDAAFDLLDGLEPSVKSDEGMINLTYDITLEKVEKGLKKAVNEAKLTEDTTKVLCEVLGLEAMTPEQLRSFLLEQIDEFMDSTDPTIMINSKMKVRINAETGMLERISISLSEHNELVEMVCSFTSSGMKLTFRAAAGSVDYMNATIETKKTVKGDLVEFSADLSATSEGETFALNASVKYNKASGEFEISATADVPGQQAASIGLKGNISKTDKSLTVKVNEVYAQDVSLKFDLSITFEKGVAVPAVPADAKDIKTLTPQEWDEIFGKLGVSRPIYGTYSYERDDGFVEEWDFYDDTLYISIDRGYEYATVYANVSIDGTSMYFDNVVKDYSCSSESYAQELASKLQAPMEVTFVDQYSIKYMVLNGEITEIPLYDDGSVYGSHTFDLGDGKYEQWYFDGDEVSIYSYVESVSKSGQGTISLVGSNLSFTDYYPTDDSGELEDIFTKTHTIEFGEGFVVIDGVTMYEEEAFDYGY